jgi:hypothetical protein
MKISPLTTARSSRIAPLLRVGLGLALTLAWLPLARAENADNPAADNDDGRVRLFAKARARDGGKLAFFWKQIEGPTVKIADPSNSRLDETDTEKRRWISETYYIPTEPGKYTFELSVKNEDGQESKKVFPPTEVLPPKPAPTAVAGPDQDKRSVGDLVRLNGADSKAAEGRTITKWEWTLVQGPPKFKPDAKLLQQSAWDFKAEEAGVYQFELRVFDGKRWSVPSRLVVTVRPVSLPPIIESEDSGSKKSIDLPTPSPSVSSPAEKIFKVVVAPGREIKLGETFVLDGSASNPPADNHPEFFWHQTDERSGPLAKQMKADKVKMFDRGREDLYNYPVWTCTPTEPGVYRFVLDITLADGTKKQSEAVAYTVVDPSAPVAPANPPAPAADGSLLSAHISAERVNVDAGETVRLSGAKSTPDGVKLKYVWGPVAGKLHPKRWSGDDGPEVEFQVEEEGEYGVSLRVTNGDKESPPDQIIITVGPPNKPPVIELPATYEAAVGDKLTLDAKVTDPEGDKFSLKWVCLEPADLQIKDEHSKVDLSTLPSLVFKPWKPGRYVFRITAVDAKGHSSKAETTISVKPAVERQPTAKIVGPKGNVIVNKKVVLDGSESFSPSHNSLVYNWRQEDGPAIPGDAPNHKQNKWEFIPKEPGKYVVSLEVVDGTIKSPLEKIVVEAGNATHPPPVAKIAGPAAVKIDVGESLLVDGSESSADEHAKITFHWTKLDGTAELKLDDAETPKVRITGVSGGPARVQLVVNDGGNDSNPAIVVVNVGKGHGKPIAHVTGPTEAKAGMPVVLSAAESSADSEITSWIWSQAADGGPKTDLRSRDMRKKELRFDPKLPGTYVFTLIVVDGKGVKSEPVTHSIEVKGASKPPNAVAGLLRENNNPPAVGKVVKLSARGSLDPQGSPLTYKWKQVSGDPLELPAEMGEIINVMPKAPGKYVFELVVNNGESDSAPVEAEFTVDGPHSAPVAVIGDIAAGEPGEKVVLDGSASKGGDSSGKLEYHWTKTSGPDARFMGRNAETRPKLEIIPQQEGEYVFELKVFDGKVWSEPVQAAFKTRAQNVAPTALIAIPNNSRELHTEENMETILDGTTSTDPDGGPKPLTYAWKQIDGPRVELKAEGAIARFTPSRQGNYKFQLIVNDGKVSSPPSVVTVVVMKAGTMPVAVPDFSPKPAKAANRQLRNNLLILDGTKSKPQNKRLTYQWKQIGGEDLHLPPDRLNKDRVGLLVYVPGLYKFTLTVSDDQFTSQPTVLEINVAEDAAAGTTPAPTAPEATEKKKPESPPEPKGPSSSDAGHRDGALLPPPKDAEKSVTPETASKSNSADQVALKKKLEELAKTPGPEADKALAEALANPDKDVRATAVESLYRRGISSIPALIGALESPSATARNEAYAALKELTHETLGPEPEKWKDWWAAQPVAKVGSANE